MRFGGTLLVIAGCRGHMHFTAPPPTLSQQERVGLYNDLVGTHERILFDNKGGQQRSIVMANGYEIDYPEDLLPLVADNSATAKHARVAAKARKRALQFSLAGVAGFIVGMGLVFRSEDRTDSAGVVGPAFVIGGLISAVVVGTVYRRRSYSNTHDAIVSFNDDFAARLNVCANGYAIVPCETLQQPPTPSEPPAPPREKLPAGKIVFYLP